MTSFLHGFHLVIVPFVFVAAKFANYLYFDGDCAEHTQDEQMQVGGQYASGFIALISKFPDRLKLASNFLLYLAIRPSQLVVMLYRSWIVSSRKQGHKIFYMPHPSLAEIVTNKNN
jgi:hypothetical protein